MKNISGGKFGALLLGTMIAIFMMAVLIFFFFGLYMNNNFSIVVALVFVTIVAPLVARAIFRTKKTEIESCDDKADFEGKSDF